MLSFVIKQSELNRKEQIMYPIYIFRFDKTMLLFLKTDILLIVSFFLSIESFNMQIYNCFK